MEMSRTDLEEIPLERFEWFLLDPTTRQTHQYSRTKDSSPRCLLIHEIFNYVELRGRIVPSDEVLLSFERLVKLIGFGRRHQNLRQAGIYPISTYLIKRQGRTYADVNSAVLIANPQSCLQTASSPKHSSDSSHPHNPLPTSWQVYSTSTRPLRNSNRESQRTGDPSVRRGDVCVSLSLLLRLGG